MAVSKARGVSQLEASLQVLHGLPVHIYTLPAVGHMVDALAYVTQPHLLAQDLRSAPASGFKQVENLRNQLDSQHSVKEQ